MKWLDVIALLVVAALAYTTFSTKQRATAAQAEIARLQSEIKSARSEIKVLKAEQTFLKSPERLAELAKKELNMDWARPDQMRKGKADGKLSDAKNEQIKYDEGRDL